MTPLPSSPTQPHWRSVLPDLENRLSAERVLVASDFDGTLSHIAPTPDEAVILPESRAALDRLGRSPGVVVAVISGRALVNVREKVGLSHLIYAGSHGVEMEGPSLPPFRILTKDDRGDLAAAVASLRSALDGIAGVLVEDNGSSVSVHYRMAEVADYDAVAAAVVEAVALSAQIQLRHGKMVWDLRPDMAGSKGSAVIRLMARFNVLAASAFFLGDDATDDDAFHILPRGATFIVGERPAAEAAYRCDSPEDAAALLTWMAEARERLAPPASGIS